MLSEWLYRALLVVYPREHRWEYGDLMVQMFRDRMRYDGGGFRGLIVWTQMMRDLFVSAYEEHEIGGNMKKRIWIVPTSVIALLIIVAGVSVVLSQPDDEFENDELNMRVFVLDGSDIFWAEGKNGVTELLEQELDEDVSVHESEFGFELSSDEMGIIVIFDLEELPAAGLMSSWDTPHLSAKGEEYDIFITAWLDSYPLPPTREEVDEFLEATEYFAEDLRRWVKDGEMDQEEADRELERARRWDTIVLEHWD